MKLATRVLNLAESATLAVTAKAARMKAEGIDVISFGAGEPDFDTPEHIRKAAIAAIEAGQTRYSKPASGIPAAKKAVCDKLARENQLTYTPDQVIVTAGAKMAIHLAVHALIDPGDEVVVPAPYWVSYPEITKLAGGVPVFVAGREADDYKLAPEDSEIQMYEKYGLEILAIWRQGKAYRSDLGSMKLRLGDAFLVLGPRDKLAMLERDPDFLVLTPVSRRVMENHKKAPVALVILAGFIIVVLTGTLPIAVAAVIAAALMVLSGCLTMEEGYRSIEWQAIFLIAGMLPLGIALQDTGAAQLAATGVVGLLADFGPWAVIFAFYGLTALATLFIPTAALVVLMAPVVMSASYGLGVEPQTAMMAIAIAASASFGSPIAHPANLLVMGPGGYSFADYLRVGLPLSLVVMIVTMIFLPLIWPLHPLG